MLNVAAIRYGYGVYTGGRMAAFNLSSGVLCVALVARFVLGEELTPRKLVGFGLMFVAMFLIAMPSDPSEQSEQSEPVEPVEPVKT